MKKIFAFTQSREGIMGGTDTYIGAFTTYEMAKETHEAMIKRSLTNHNGSRFVYSDIVEVEVYEQRDEIPFI